MDLSLTRGRFGIFQILTTSRLYYIVAGLAYGSHQLSAVGHPRRVLNHSFFIRIIDGRFEHALCLLQPSFYRGGTVSACHPH